MFGYDAYYYYQDGTLWDHTGNPVKRVENFGGNDFTTTLRYDNVYRQIEETKRDYLGATVYSLTYGYDQVGNRTSMTRDGISYTYVYDDNNKLSTVTSGGNTASFSYDLNGNLTNVDGLLYPTRTMTYNDENRLSSVTFNGYTDTYTYNWQGLRTRANLNGTYYRYIYNGERVLEELNDSGGVLARYTTENDSYYGTLLHLQRSTGESRFPIYDEIGSARGLIDTGGTVTDSYDMDTFGKPIQTTGSTPNPYRYGAAWGYITDPNGFLQLGARFYP